MSAVSCWCIHGDDEATRSNSDRKFIRHRSVADAPGGSSNQRLVVQRPVQVARGNAVCITPERNQPDDIAGGTGNRDSFASAHRVGPRRSQPYFELCALQRIQKHHREQRQLVVEAPAATADHNQPCGAKAGCIVQCEFGITFVFVDSVPKEFLDYALRPDNPLTIDPAVIAERRAEWLEQFSDIMLR